MNIYHKYYYYTLEDFVWDEKFRQWITEPVHELDDFWVKWLQEHPEKVTLVKEAALQVKLLQPKEPSLQESEIAAAIEDILIKIEIKPASGRSAHFRIAGNFRRLSVAAILLIMASSALLWWNSSDNISNDKYSELVSMAQKDPYLRETVNSSDTSLFVYLPDGSSVLLEPAAKISYYTSLTLKNAREVYLSGNAFFKVAPDKSKPFLVYANHLITKVLGTSFEVNAASDGTDAVVRVKTGKVMVMENKELRQYNNIETLEVPKLVLTPNQQVSYKVNENQLVAGLVKSPSLLYSDTDDELEGDFFQPKESDFVFKSQSLDEVLNVLYNSYGIEIVAENPAIYRCKITLDLSGYDLYTKVLIICTTLNISYEVRGTRIVFSGNGCRQ